MMKAESLKSQLTIQSVLLIHENRWTTNFESNCWFAIWVCRHCSELYWVEIPFVQWRECNVFDNIVIWLSARETVDSLWPWTKPHLSAGCSRSA